MRVHVIALALVAFGCGGGGYPGIADDGGSAPSPSPSPSPSSSSTSSAAPSLFGTWKGTFQSQSGGGGLATLVLSSSGSVVTGRVEFVDAPCFANASLKGTLHATKLTADVSDGENRAQLSATVNGGTMVGTYEVGQGDACSNDRGTVAFARSQ